MKWIHAKIACFFGIRSMKNDFPYKRILITGASSGLGEALCRLLAREGSETWGVSRDASRVRVEGVHPHALDLSDASEVRAFAENELPGMEIDLLVNAAGCGVFGNYEEMTLDEIEAQRRVMLDAPMALCLAVLPGMKQRGRGCIVNVSSMAAVFPLPCMAVYNVAKAGLSALSASLVEEARGAGVRVIDFQPGDFNSGFFMTTRRKGGSEGAWNAAEKHLDGAPDADAIAASLRKAVAEGREGTVRAGTFFQCGLAPLGKRLIPEGLFLRIQRKYLE